MNNSGSITDCQFFEIVNMILPGDLLVFNDTSVIPARIEGHKKTGGKVSLLCERIIDANRFIAQAKSSRALKVGDSIIIDEIIHLKVLTTNSEFAEIQVAADAPFYGDIGSLLKQHGRTPLPPYIKRAVEAKDYDRYQTVYHRVPGAVAAPTAGLHFDRQLLHRVTELGVDAGYLTLHIGAGTFKPIRCDDIQQHRMHQESYNIPESLVAKVGKCRQRGGRVIAVGTTTVRALESASHDDGTLRAGHGDTELYITPGFRFNTVDLLLTNFHTPKSSLLVMVAAFAGYKPILSAYQHALNRNYRFLSYGDSMLLEKAD